MRRHPQLPLSFRVRLAVESADLRAAAQLRAAAFYHYPLDRSEFAARVRQKHFLKDRSSSGKAVPYGQAGCRI